MATTASAQGPLQNLYHKRAVAASSAKPCTICYKSTAVVLITPDSRDFFYVCAGHLADKGFASPAPGEGRDLKKEREDALQAEIEKVKAEYEEKVKRRKEKKAKKDAEKDKDGDDKKDATERDAKVAELEQKKKEDAAAEQSEDKKSEADGARIFVLHRGIFSMRVAKLQQAASARRRAEQLRNPAFFPAVPRGP